MGRLNNTNSQAYLLALVALLAAIGPFVTDFYLPAFPQMREFFGVNASMIQLSLTACMVGLALGQLFIGPLSDKYGRKLPLLVSISIFIVSTIACIFAWSIESFVVFRFIQGLSGSSGIVISKSIVVDSYEGKKMADFFSMLSLVQAIAPIFSPIMGGLLLNVTDWRGIFVTLVLIEIIMLFFVARFKESLPVQKRSTGKILNTFKGYGIVLRNKKFMSFTMVQFFAMGILFAYIASSPFIFQQSYGLSPLQYSLCFTVNGLAIMLGHAVVTKFSSSGKALITGTRLIVLMGILLALTLTLQLPLLVLEIVMFVFLIAVGMLLPTSSTLALGLERNNSGKASAVLGFLGFLAGGLASPLTGLGNILYSTGVIILFCCLCSAFFAYKAIGKREKIAEASTTNEDA
ncbi:multidrug effflux MFS transporter [Parabacteroides sp. Marseille-P3160]|uniref:multidrug effflux MFS transporter n=1 Tax=Parabacteroides sp. Marseille-P3160 TaxID=1917887 RepID=UPI0009BA8ABA|nr:multidrug effflux MFS transporter [Parabacteroides sp. Marseille-P3160]